MTSVIFLAILQNDKVEAAIERFKVAMHGMPRYEVQLVSKDIRRPDFSADLIVDGRKRLFYDAKTPVGHYTLSIAPAGHREVDERSKTYDEWPYLGSVEFQASRLSRVANTVPGWLLVTDLHRMFPRGSKVAYRGTDVVTGHSCDIVRCTFTGPNGSGYLDFYIGKSGLVYRHYRNVDSMDGHEEVTWDFKDYRPFTKISDSRFENRIPDGFMPYSLPDRIVPAEIGKNLKLQGWTEPSTMRRWTQPTGRPVLFVLIGRDSMPSEKAVSALDGWLTALRGKGVSVVMASDSPTASGAKGRLFDPDGKSVELLGAPSTPMYYLIDSHGILRNLWMGFAPSNAGKMREALFAAVAALK